MKYEPRLNDYVSWRNVEGWVYFVTDEYLTIEISVKPKDCLLYTSPSPRDYAASRMPSSA